MNCQNCSKDIYVRPTKSSINYQEAIYYCKFCQVDLCAKCANAEFKFSPDGCFHSDPETCRRIIERNIRKYPYEEGGFYHNLLKALNDHCASIKASTAE